MKRRFIVKVGEKTFPVEVEEVEGETVAHTESPLITPPARVEAPVSSVEALPRPKERVEAATGSISAPLPGKIVSIKCKVGDSVNAGETVLVLESMKMENSIAAPKSGRVKEISVNEGDKVALGDILLVIE